MAALNAEIPGDLKKAVEKACTDRNKTLKVAVAEALTQWLEGSKEEHVEESSTTANSIAASNNSPATLGVPRSEWHRMLDQVLDTRVTNPLVINVVTCLLSYGYDAVAISKGHYRKYEVETRVLRELTAELLGSQQAEEITALAEFMSSATKGDREMIQTMVEAWKNKSRETSQREQSKSTEETPRKRKGDGRKAS